MKEFITQDGTRIHLPHAQQRPADGDYCCDCHTRMGNDFYFLPINSCLRADKICNKER